DSGLIAGLRAAAELGAVDVEVRMDSKLVVEQMAGRWQIRNTGLRPLAAQAAELVRRFDSVRFSWVPREENIRADALANAAMNGQPAPEVELDLPPVAATPAGATPAVGRARSTTGAGILAPRSWAPPEQTATRLLLVRHGETEQNSQRRYSGRRDVPLSDRGVAQARAVAGRVAVLAPAVAAVVTSPLTRCAATAEE